MRKSCYYLLNFFSYSWHISQPRNSKFCTYVIHNDITAYCKQCISATSAFSESILANQNELFCLCFQFFIENLIIFYKTHYVHYNFPAIIFHLLFTTFHVYRYDNTVFPFFWCFTYNINGIKKKSSLPWNNSLAYLYSWEFRLPSPSNFPSFAVSNIFPCPTYFHTINFKPLNTKLNPICHLLALLGAHHILHVSGLRVKFSKAANCDFKLIVFPNFPLSNLLHIELLHNKF